MNSYKNEGFEMTVKGQHGLQAVRECLQLSGISVATCLRTGCMGQNFLILQTNQPFIPIIDILVNAFSVLLSSMFLQALPVATRAAEGMG